MHRESIYKNYMPAIKAEHANKTNSYWFIFYSDKLLIKADDNKADIPFAKSLEDLNITAERTQYLGTLKGHPCYSAEISSDIIDSKSLSFKSLRSLFSILEEDVFILAGKAFQIVNWDKTHQYCGKCGSETYTMESERAKKCPKCGFTSYPVLSPAVITAIIKDKKILLAHNRSFPGKRYGLIAGFVEPGETLEECVKREAMEEVGISIKSIRYLGSQPWPFPNSLMIGFTAEYESGEIKEDGEEIDAADWFEVNNLPEELPSEISIANKIINWYIENFKVK
ncbi:NAD(+) diphosphatase [Clostridium sp. YIM B02515]|uniref:NAD(+) diphosphatase n=1 Tax=Clostridium rhizosphaerae TaxID=2803861 RepID=A0ABS1TFW9_9CLOT|nr:NAD(+) diphosphatase [Clostridium rhizosphaerae]MBL4938266.1 NAD(+) diphosphatase [Clostridium rhizosphaerae]